MHQARALSFVARGRFLSALGAGLLAAVGIAALASDAHASGFSTARFGGEHGNVTESNPTALYYNPAGIADREPGKDAPFNVRIMVDGNFALRGGSYSRTTAGTDVAEPAGGEGANTGSASLFNVVAAPMAGAIFKIGDFAVGASFSVPLGGQSTWSKNSDFEGNTQFAGPVDGVQRWATIDGSLRSIYLTAGAAYDIGKYVSVGVSGNLILSEVRTVRARTALGDNNLDTEGRSLIDVKGTNGSFGVGVLAEPIPGKLWIGASYQAQPGLGTMALKGTLTNNFGSVSEPLDVKLFQDLPDVYRLGGRWRPKDNVELRLFGEVVDWSKFENQCLIEATESTCEVDQKTGAGKGEVAPLVNLERNWDTGFGIRAGGSYWVKKEIEVFVGTGYDSNSVPDATLEPALTDFDDISLAVGGRFQLLDQLLFMASYTHFFYFPRDTTGAFELATRDLPTRVPDFGGKYTQVIGVINLNAELSF